MFILKARHTHVTHDGRIIIKIKTPQKNDIVTSSLVGLAGLSSVVDIITGFHSIVQSVCFFCFLQITIYVQKHLLNITQRWIRQHSRGRHGLRTFRFRRPCRVCGRAGRPLNSYNNNILFLFYRQNRAVYYYYIVRRRGKKPADKTLLHIALYSSMFCPEYDDIILLLLLYRQLRTIVTIKHTRDGYRDII